MSEYPLRLTVKDALLMFGRHERSCASERPGVEKASCDCLYGSSLAFYSEPSPNGPEYAELVRERDELKAALSAIRALVQQISETLETCTIYGPADRLRDQVRQLAALCPAPPEET